jgi:hypothetical protein
MNFARSALSSCTRRIASEGDIASERSSQRTRFSTGAIARTRTPYCGSSSQFAPRPSMIASPCRAMAHTTRIISRT